MPFTIHQPLLDHSLNSRSNDLEPMLRGAPETAAAASCSSQIMAG
jgi:hypothetical protein